MPELKPFVRHAIRSDAPLIHKLIMALARYEKAEDAVTATVEDIEHSLFDKGATAHALICEANAQAIGFAVYFFNYSTWVGKNGLFLEDLFIHPDARHSGAGTALFEALAHIAIANDCGRFEWNVLDWNTPAIKFYESLGAKALPEWTGYRLERAQIEALAEQATHGANEA